MSSSCEFDAKKWAARVQQLALRSLSSGKKIVVLFTTKFAVPRQLKDRILQLGIRKRQRSFSIVFIFCWLRRKRLLSRFGKTARFNCRSCCRHSHSSVKQIIFSQFFSSFESGGISKHLITGPSGIGEFCFPSTSH